MQKTNIKISVVMPVYNVAKYLERAIDSVINQTLKEFELILVDDGSTDESGLICDKYKNIDDRIVVIHKKNEGAHEARNTALKYIKGKYVCFFDSDDFVEENMLLDSYSLAEKYNSKLVISGFFNDICYSKNKYITFNYTSFNCVFNNKEDFRKSAYMFFDKYLFYSPWNKLFLSSYILNNNLLFPHTYRDDFPFVVSVIKDIDSVVFTDKLYYHFFKERTESETSKYVSTLYDKREEEHKMMMDLYKYWNLDNDPKSIEMISRRYIDRLIECICNLYNVNSKLSNIKKIEYIKKYINTDNFNFCIKYANPKKLHLKIMYIPLKLKNIFLIVLQTKFINFVRSKNLKIFSMLKKNR